MNNFLTRVLIIFCFFLSTAILAGCGPKPVEPYSPKSGNKPEGQKNNFEYTSDIAPGTISEEPMEIPLDAGSTNGVAGFNNEQNSDEYKRKHGRSSPEMQPIYFGFDQSTVRNDQVPQLELNGSYMKDNPSSIIVVEGNCDEQGTNEYNLALGERRAINAKRYLVELGVEEYRIRTNSYGEERPLFTGMNDADYAMNRRDDFILE